MRQTKNISPVCNFILPKSKSSFLLVAIHETSVEFNKDDKKQSKAFKEGEFVWINPNAPEVPFALSVKGRNNVAVFFSKFAETAEVSRFDIDNYIQEGSKVVSWGSYDAKARSTGKAFTTPIIMTWKFNPQGKCTHWQAYTNTSEQAKAYVK